MTLKCFCPSVMLKYWTQFRSLYWDSSHIPNIAWQVHLCILLIFQISKFQAWALDPLAFSRNSIHPFLLTTTWKSSLKSSVFNFPIQLIANSWQHSVPSAFLTWSLPPLWPLYTSLHSSFLFAFYSFTSVCFSLLWPDPIHSFFAQPQETSNKA